MNSNRVKYLLQFVSLVLLVACSVGDDHYDSKQISEMIATGDAPQLVRAYYHIGEQRDTTFIPFLVSQMSDPRISHDFDFLGVSVYQSKMVALKKISGLSPPRPIQPRPDSSIINFYCDWVRKNTPYGCTD